MTAPEAKEKRRAGPMTPLVLIAAFLSFTELIAGYTLLKTSGEVQLVLTVFVVVFPVLIGIAFFYLLIFRNYVLFAPHEFQGGGDVSTYVRAMKGRSERISADESALLTHAMFGVLDVIRQELPDVIKAMPEPRPKHIVLETEITPALRRVNSQRDLYHLPERITVGSFSREQAAVRFPFLAHGRTRLHTQRAVQQLTSTDLNYYYRIREDGSIHSQLNLNNLERFEQTGERVDYESFLLVQIISMIQGQLVIAFSQREELAFPGPRVVQLYRGIEQFSVQVYETALVISDEGDIFGLFADFVARYEQSLKSAT